MGNPVVRYMKKEYVRYGTLLIAIILFGLFVYPTLYRYDKLDQNLPVKINRITGATYVLHGLEWKKVSNEPAVDEVEQIKNDIYTKLEQDRSEVKDEIINEIKQQIIDEVTKGVQDKLDETMQAIEVYKETKTDPSKSFTIGSTKNEVKEIMGTPDSISKAGPYETWMYGLSTITFENGKVSGWHDLEDNLSTK